MPRPRCAGGPRGTSGSLGGSARTYLRCWDIRGINHVSAQDRGIPAGPQGHPRYRKCVSARYCSAAPLTHGVYFPSISPTDPRTPRAGPPGVQIKRAPFPRPPLARRWRVPPATLSLTASIKLPEASPPPVSRHRPLRRPRFPPCHLQAKASRPPLSRASTTLLPRMLRTSLPSRRLPPSSSRRSLSWGLALSSPRWGGEFPHPHPGGLGGRRADHRVLMVKIRALIRLRGIGRRHAGGEGASLLGPAMCPAMRPLVGSWAAILPRERVHGVGVYYITTECTHGPRKTPGTGF